VVSLSFITRGISKSANIPEASKRIEISVRDYKKFLVDGRASKKLTALVEAIADDLKAPFEPVVGELEYRVVKEAKAEEV